MMICFVCDSRLPSQSTFRSVLEQKGQQKQMDMFGIPRLSKPFS